MTAYLLVLIVFVAVGIPFLLYCLWNFARDLRPLRSVLVSSRVSGTSARRTIPASHVRSRPRIVSLREKSRAAS
jgi:hypothetical protein